ncbi:LysM peptidoglycan-binding domain-containing protein [Algibacter sp. 2305UL17-15]|uniref:CIS tube protein n=1 Tax=Algibacter sp. 2305UL17-15 TaxID=3231268 RepID=UPI003457991C
MLSTGELTKLKIIAYSGPEFNESDKVSDGEFETLINPEKYVFNYVTEQNEDQATGTSANSTRFNKKLPEVIDLDIVFDRTGAIKTSKVSDEGIIDDIEDFKKVVLEYDGENHQPNYLKVSWGTLLFKGKLTEMSIEFKLFRPDGVPIRAIAKIKLTGFVEDDLRVAKENNQSPDLTHLRTVKDGDTLPLMSYRIYGDSKYYLEVAKANGITNFRHLTIGQQLVFPPLEKTS